jgi:hypothetical protein
MSGCGCRVVGPWREVDLRPRARDGDLHHLGVIHERSPVRRHDTGGGGNALAAEGFVVAVEIDAPSTPVVGESAWSVRSNEISTPFNVRSSSGWPVSWTRRTA